ncbi:MAG TPA: hypothetical protein VK501_21170 [Baekduia sp.]|uniref:hypothetical protein n=1 Tax=Baekduia sp. TaxID=2600305 RepID=UPI002D19328F|nr:hypothetical protein [Baekduia sp.]HMJ36428.1 hypothetical protein [Baekduia sp.]
MPARQQLEGSLEDQRRWRASYVDDVDAIHAFLGVDGIAVAARRVAVIDSGDGILALGLAQRLGAAQVAGFDDEGCNTVTLATWAGWYSGSAQLPAHLRFVGTRPYEIPGEPGGYDLAVWWGDIGTRRDPVRVLREVRRLLAPQAHVLLRVPPNGSPGLDELQHAVLAAGLAPARVEVDAATVRPDLEQRAQPLNALATRGARMLAYRVE